MTDLNEFERQDGSVVCLFFYHMNIIEMIKKNFLFLSHVQFVFQFS